MTTWTFLGDFPQVALALAFSLGCALLGAFLFLRVVVSLVTREQYNVTDAPRRVRALVWMGHGGNRSNVMDGRSSDATGGSYLLAAAAPHNRFARIPKLDDDGAGRFGELAQRAGRRIEESGTGDGGAA